MPRFYRLLLLLILGATLPALAQYPASCDGDKSCVGNALTITKTAGKGAEYVDVDTSSTLRTLDAGLTFEAWLSPQEQPGRRFYVAGLWGPNKDNNDQWVVYIEGTKITFALSQDGSYKGDADNTVTTVNLPDMYTRGWFHLAAVWDGATTSARIFINGFQVSAATNVLYPMTHLHQPESRALPLQIGSSNALYDDTLNYRTFKGQLDEIKLWDRALSPDEIRCQYQRSLNGNEPGLVLYYRCNESVNAQELCDATGHGIRGQMRSGAYCDKSTRVMDSPYIVSPGALTSPLYCTSDTTFTFTITDTSFCGDKVYIGMSGKDRSLFTPSTNNLTLTQNVPQTFTVHLNAVITGTLSASIDIVNANRCGNPVRVPITFTRTTDLHYSKPNLVIDTLFVGCTTKTFSEDTVTICNTTGVTKNIYAVSLDSTAFTWRAADPAKPLPQALPPGGCWTAIVRMNAGDTTMTLRDTLRINSDDKCPGSGAIPIVGYTQDVIEILNPNGKGRLTKMQFEAVCPGQISNVQLYQYRDMTNEPINIDSIYYSKEFFGRRFAFPIILKQNTAYQAEYIRFKPDHPGPFVDSIVFITNFRGCLIRKSIQVTGRGISVDVGFDSPLVGFGNVTIGKTKQQVVTVTNHGLDARKMSAYLKVGDVFSIIAGGSFVIDPGKTVPITLLFRPREPKTYFDTLAIFDENCYGTFTVPVTGTGVFEALEFTPPYLSLDNVAACKCKTTTIDVKNILTSSATITSATLNDATGKFTMVGPTSGTLAPQQKYSYTITYCPNDLTTDRADNAYIDIKLSDGQFYQVLLRANSVVPKLYVEPLTVYGPVEVGWQKSQKILVENVSAGPILLDVPPTVPAGYSVTSITPPLPVTLQPRDSIILDVKFAPTAAGPYTGAVTVTSTNPCTISETGQVDGSGTIVKLDVPISFVNYGLVKPCDCAVREIPMPNHSNYIPITIDSVWLDGKGVTNARPAVFVWKSSQHPAGVLPFQIPPQTADTLLVSFCPNIPAIPANILSNATLHIKASTPGWSQEFTTIVSGQRELNFQPSKSLVQFPATRVDTAATPIGVDITVPDAFSNPSGDSIVFDGAWFVPDQRVFSVQANTGQPFNWVIQRGQKFGFKINFTPRAPKKYSARLHLHTIFPCVGEDTTILVNGEGFAPAFGLQMAFDTTIVGKDTMHLTTCDTLVLPIMSSRAIPQNIIDFFFRIGYDTSQLKFLDVQTPYTTNTSVTDTGDGAHIILKDARDVPAGRVATVRFTVKPGGGASPIFLDEIDFDSDSLVFFKIVAGIDKGWVVIDDPRIAISKTIAFDTVNLKSCATKTITVWNPGLVPVRFDGLRNLPPGHVITATSRVIPDTLAPGDSVVVTITFCPFIEKLYDTLVEAYSTWPCPISDTSRLHSFGYAPPFPMAFQFDTHAGVADTVHGVIADTIEIPVLIDRDIPQTPLDVNFSLAYNRRALEYLSSSSTYGKPVVTDAVTGADMTLMHADSIRKGEFVRFKFIVAVPDSVNSSIRIDTNTVRFTSDSVFWVKLIPAGDTGVMRVDPKCNITRLNFSGKGNGLSRPAPNPTNGRVKFEAEIANDAAADFTIVNSSGVVVARLLNQQQLTASKYQLDFDAGGLPDGVYYCVFQAGGYKATERFVLVK